MGDTSDTRFIITGATGATGGATAAQLLEGRNVRAFLHREDERSEALRSRGAKVGGGDLLDFHAVREALRGVNRAYIVYPIRPSLVQATAQFAQSAIEAGVESIVNMSQASARSDAKSHAARDHWLAELLASASSGGARRNDAASLYAEADRITGKPGSEFLVQHLREAAIDHTNGAFAGTNDFVEKIAGRPPLTVEAFVTKHRDAFV